MNPLLAQALGSIIRWLLAFVAGVLVQHGIWSRGDADNYVAAAAFAVASLLWSFWQKYKSRIHFLTALEMPAGTPESKVVDRVNAGAGVVPMLLLAVALGGAVTLPGCAKGPAPVIVPSAPVISAVKATEVIHALDALRDVSQALSQGAQPIISPHAAAAVLTAHEALVHVIGASPNGWKATGEAVLEQLAKDLGPDYPRLQPYLTLVRTLVDAFVPAEPAPLAEVQ